MYPTLARPTVTRTTSYDQLPEWLTLREAAALLGISYFTANAMVHRGELRHQRFGSKLIYIPKEVFAQSTAKLGVTR